MNEIIDSLKKGDKKLIRRLYEELLPKVISWITNNGGSREDGSDLFHDALESIIIRAHKSSLPDQIDINAFIMQITKNKWRDQLRRKKLDDKVRLLEAERHQDEIPWEEEIIEMETTQGRYRLMRTTFNRLSLKCQNLLKMVMNESNTQEMVKELGFNNANTMYRRKFACMDSWKTLITKLKSNDS